MARREERDATRIGALALEDVARGTELRIHQRVAVRPVDVVLRHVRRPPAHVVVPDEEWTFRRVRTLVAALIGHRPPVVTTRAQIRGHIHGVHRETRLAKVRAAVRIVTHRAHDRERAVRPLRRERIVDLLVHGVRDAHGGRERDLSRVARLARCVAGAIREVRHDPVRGLRPLLDEGLVLAGVAPTATRIQSRRNVDGWDRLIGDHLRVLDVILSRAVAGFTLHVLIALALRPLVAESRHARVVAERAHRVADAALRRSVPARLEIRPRLRMLGGEPELLVARMAVAAHRERARAARVAEVFAGARRRRRETGEVLVYGLGAADDPQRRERRHTEQEQTRTRE